MFHAAGVATVFAYGPTNREAFAAITKKTFQANDKRTSERRIDVVKLVNVQNKPTVPLMIENKDNHTDPHFL